LSDKVTRLVIKVEMNKRIKLYQRGCNSLYSWEPCMRQWLKRRISCLYISLETGYSLNFQASL